jgi:hypothetical protein
MATTLTLADESVQEEFFDRGLTDGLPIVPLLLARAHLAPRVAALAS